MKNSTAKKLKQVPEGYLIIGVDPHKKKHAVVVMTQDAIAQTKFKFSNSRDGFEEVLQRARAEMLKSGSRGVIFAVETASHYWRNLAYFLLDEHGIPYYHCYRKGNPDRVPLSPDGKPQPCSCPEIKGEAIEAEVWDTICQLIKDPDILIQELRRRNADNSQTKEIMERELQLCQARLKAIPDEQRRLVEGYRKGLYADFMMREDMELIQKEQGELEKRKAELERQLARRSLTQDSEVRIRSLMEKISIGLENLDFTGKQELLRLLVEKVFYDGQSVEILTIIPVGEQLHPIQPRGIRGEGYLIKTER